MTINETQRERGQVLTINETAKRFVDSQDLTPYEDMTPSEDLTPVTA